MTTHIFTLHPARKVDLGQTESIYSAPACHGGLGARLVHSQDAVLKQKLLT